MKNCFLVGTIFLFAAGLSAAAQKPQGLASDARIKVVTYDPNNVVEVSTRFGYATTIVLGQGEYVTLDGGMGKKAGWEVVSKPHSNFIVVKPKLDNNETNLNFKTNKNRIYALSLKASDNKRHPTYMLRFEYPEHWGHSPFSSRKQTYEMIENFGNPKDINDQYSFSGDTTIAPVKAQDNATFTLLRFRKGRPVPAILAVDPVTRKESLVNFRVQGDFVVVEGVYQQMTLRYGPHVTCLFNDKAIASWYRGKPGVKRIKKRIVYAKDAIKRKPARRTK